MLSRSRERVVKGWCKKSLKRLSLEQRVEPIDRNGSTLTAARHHGVGQHLSYRHGPVHMVIAHVFAIDLATYSSVRAECDSPKRGSSIGRKKCLNTQFATLSP